MLHAVDMTVKIGLLVMGHAAGAVKRNGSFANTTTKTAIAYVLHAFKQEPSLT